MSSSGLDQGGLNRRTAGRHRPASALGGQHQALPVHRSRQPARPRAGVSAASANWFAVLVGAADTGDDQQVMLRGAGERCRDTATGAGAAQPGQTPPASPGPFGADSSVTSSRNSNGMSQSSWRVSVRAALGCRRARPAGLRVAGGEIPPAGLGRDALQQRLVQLGGEVLVAGRGYAEAAFGAAQDALVGAEFEARAVIAAGIDRQDSPGRCRAGSGGRSSAVCSLPSGAVTTARTLPSASGCEIRRQRFAAQACSCRRSAAYGPTGSVPGAAARLRPASAAAGATGVRGSGPRVRFRDAFATASCSAPGRRPRGRGRSAASRHRHQRFFIRRGGPASSSVAPGLTCRIGLTMSSGGSVCQRAIESSRLSASISAGM